MAPRRKSSKKSTRRSSFKRKRSAAPRRKSYVRKSYSRRSAPRRTVRAPRSQGLFDGYSIDNLPGQQYNRGMGRGAQEHRARITKAIQDYKKEGSRINMENTLRERYANAGPKVKPTFIQNFNMAFQNPKAFWSKDNVTNMADSILNKVPTAAAGAGAALGAFNPIVGVAAATLGYAVADEMVDVFWRGHDADPGRVLGNVGESMWYHRKQIYQNTFGKNQYSGRYLQPIEDAENYDNFKRSTGLTTLFPNLPTDFVDHKRSKAYIRRTPDGASDREISIFQDKVNFNRRSGYQIKLYTPQQIANTVQQRVQRDWIDPWVKSAKLTNFNFKRAMGWTQPKRVPRPIPKPDINIEMEDLRDLNARYNYNSELRRRRTRRRDPWNVVDDRESI